VKNNSSPKLSEPGKPWGMGENSSQHPGYSDNAQRKQDNSGN